MNRGFLLRLITLFPLLGFLLLSSCTLQPNPRGGESLEAFISANYDKREVLIPMRDGVRLFTAIYTPKDQSRSYPFLMKRTPYSVSPYGGESYPSTLGPSDILTRELFIFVLQDVRGTYLSEGRFVNMTPHLDEKSGSQDIDESSDAYDTIEWLLANVENHNGRVGMWGISYPGFYSAASMIDAHPALQAVSPQAPIADWWFDDFHHHGAFFLPHAFNFLSSFGVPRPEPTTQRNPRFDHGTPDGYDFFLEMGPLGNANTLYLNHRIPFWDSIIAHPNYDGFWQPRNLIPHLNNTAPAVMTVGGWYDAEDLFGPLNIYRSVEEKNPGIHNTLVMGPWRHGGWARDDGTFLGNAWFGSETAVFYRENIEAVFFRHFLKDEGEMELPEAYVFETGKNRWRTFQDWPPAATREAFLYPGAQGSLAFEPSPAGGGSFDQWVSDPANPVPSTQDIDIGMAREYMTDDQRFASRRPDVVAYQTPVLEEDVTLAGPLLAQLWVSTSGTASDWVVKLVDVFPPDAEDPPHEAFARGMRAGGAQMMVRSEVIRGRFRNSYENPEPFVPNQPTLVELPLQDVLHTFQAGHRIMIQFQSTWFPLVDRNPQRYVENIYRAREGDFISATQRLYRSDPHRSRIRVGVLAGGGSGER